MPVVELVHYCPERVVAFLGSDGLFREIPGLVEIRQGATRKCGKIDGLSAPVLCVWEGEGKMSALNANNFPAF